MISDKPETRVIADDSIYHASYLPQVRLEEHHVRQLVEVIIRDSSSSRRIAKMCRSLWNASYKIVLRPDKITGNRVRLILQYSRDEVSGDRSEVEVESHGMAA